MATPGNLSLLGGLGTLNYAQIGHGGNDSSTVDVNGNTSGSIRVINSTSVTLQGNGTDSYAQLGHGGLNNAGNHGESGDLIEVNSTGAVTVKGGGSARSSALLGHGGRLANGTLTAAISVNARSVNVQGGSSSESWAMIGLGGQSGTFNTSGSISVTASDDISVTGNTSNSYAQIGSGGRLIPAGTFDADITVAAGRNLTLTGGTGPIVTQ